MADGIGATSAAPGDAAPSTRGRAEEDLVELGGTAPKLADASDLETRNRLRRALRILLAARRRDDGSIRHIDN